MRLAMVFPIVGWGTAGDCGARRDVFTTFDDTSGVVSLRVWSEACDEVSSILCAVFGNDHEFARKVAVSDFAGLGKAHQVVTVKGVRVLE